jgi:hypothetical protein
MSYYLLSRRAGICVVIHEDRPSQILMPTLYRRLDGFEIVEFQESTPSFEEVFVALDNSLDLVGFAVPIPIDCCSHGQPFCDCGMSDKEGNEVPHGVGCLECMSETIERPEDEWVN